MRKFLHQNVMLIVAGVIMGIIFLIMINYSNLTPRSKDASQKEAYQTTQTILLGTADGQYAFTKIRLKGSAADESCNIAAVNHVLYKKLPEKRYVLADYTEISDQYVVYTSSSLFTGNGTHTSRAFKEIRDMFTEYAVFKCGEENLMRFDIWPAPAVINIINIAPR